MKKTKKTLYWDIDTEAILKSNRKRYGSKKASDSLQARIAIRLTPFEKMVKELNKELGLE